MPHIQKNIPIPPISNRSRSMADLLNAMEVGDSFIADSQKMVQNAYLTAKTLGIKVVRRSIIGKKGKFRVWRTE